MKLATPQWAPMRMLSKLCLNIKLLKGNMVQVNEYMTVRDEQPYDEAYYEVHDDGSSFVFIQNDLDKIVKQTTTLKPAGSSIKIVS